MRDLKSCTIFLFIIASGLFFSQRTKSYISGYNYVPVNSPGKTFIATNSGITNGVFSSQRVLIDVGETATPTSSPDQWGKYWNNMTDGRPGQRINNAVTTNNTPTTIKLDVINRIDGTAAPYNPGTSTSGVTAVVGDYPVSATQDAAVAHYSATNGMWKIYGLNPSSNYTVKFWGSRALSGIRFIEIKRTDQTVWQEYNASLNTNFNTAASFSFTGQSEMSFDIRVKSGSTFSYINVVDISIDDPSSQSPIANAGNDITLMLPANSTQLDGVASSDPDGSITQYQWQKISGPSQFSINNNTIVNPIISNLAAGDYAMQLKVTDNTGLVDYDTKHVFVVNSSNTLPVAVAGPDQTIIAPASSVLVNGSASFDQDGTISLYKWSKISGPSSFLIVNDAVAQTPIQNLIEGIYYFELKVTDNQSGLGRDTIKISVNPQPPPEEGADILNCGKAFKIVVLGSSTAAGKMADPIDSAFVNKLRAYVKTKNSLNDVVNLATPALTTYEVLCPNDYIPPPNRPAPNPIRNISAALGLHPDAIIINLPSNDIVFGYTLQEQADNYERTMALVGNMPVFVSTSQPRTQFNASQRDTLKALRDWTYTRFGSHTIDFWTTLANTDGTIKIFYDSGDGVHLNNYGHDILFKRTRGEKILDELCILKDIAPIARAGTDIVLTLPTNSTTLNGSSSSDADGNIASYRWRKISGPANGNISDSTIANTQAINLVVGQYKFELKVTDNLGKEGRDTIIVSVQSNLNIKPIANAGSDQIIYLPQNSVTINGSASNDPDGIIVSYQWSKVSGPANYSLTNPNAVSTTVTNLTGGIYWFQLTVTDDSAAVSKDTIVITVSSAQRVLIDVGQSTTQTSSPDQWGKYWNNMTDARPGLRVNNAVNTTNTATTIKLEVINRIDGTYNTAGTGTSTSGNIGIVGDYPASATNDNALAHYSTTNGRWRIYGLNSSFNYTIKFWGSRAPSGTRIIQIKRADQTTWQEYNASQNKNFNTAASFSFSGTSEMSFDIRVKAGSTLSYIDIVDISFSSSVGNTIPKSTVVNEVTNTEINREELNLENKNTEVYPNPTENSIYLKMQNTFKGAINISISNRLGIIVKEFRFNKNTNQANYKLNLDDLHTDIYFLKIRSEGIAETLRIIKF